MNPTTPTRRSRRTGNCFYRYALSTILHYLDETNFWFQSAIVRIMKSRKKMKHVQLVQEVIQQVKARFPPKIPDIKKNIEALMEKDYIERLDGDELAYIA